VEACGGSSQYYREEGIFRVKLDGLAVVLDGCLDFQEGWWHFVGVIRTITLVLMEWS